jgi:ABC-type spermidine/putrescine transport system permease subunit II
MDHVKTIAYRLLLLPALFAVLTAFAVWSGQEDGRLDQLSAFLAVAALILPTTVTATAILALGGQALLALFAGPDFTLPPPVAVFFVALPLGAVVSLLEIRARRAAACRR